jgi:hypothetical protein
MFLNWVVQYCTVQAGARYIFSSRGGDVELHDIVTNETKYFAGQVDSIDEERKHCQKRNKFSLLNPKDRMFEEAWAKDISS